MATLKVADVESLILQDLAFVSDPSKTDVCIDDDDDPDLDAALLAVDLEYVPSSQQSSPIMGPMPSRETTSAHGDPPVLDLWLPVDKQMSLLQAMRIPIGPGLLDPLEEPIVLPFELLEELRDERPPKLSAKYEPDWSCPISSYVEPEELPAVSMVSA